ncbi:MAG: ABC transporter permease [Candidatus Bipolaricaulota bacterium]|nr:ABC transporter permease [Candidatus Bipolaricaulota bacterium]
MLKYVIKRLLWMPVVLLLVVTLVFFLTHMVPGSAVRVLLGPHAGVAQLEKATAEYGLDKPLLTQYFLYMGHLLQGDLGRSIVTRRTVASELMAFLPATLELTLYSLILIVVVGIVLGVVAAVHRNSIFDVMARGVAVGGVALPQFWLGLMFILLFSFYVRWFPMGGRLEMMISPPPRVTGMYTIDSLLAGNLRTFWDAVRHLALPVLVMALTNLSTTTAMVRSSMLRTLNEDFTLMAKAYGHRPFRVHYVYALKNSLISAVSVIGLTTGYLLGGDVLVETVFDWPGIGLYAARSILHVDYAPVIGVALLIAAVYAVVNLVTDLLYGVLDPRIRY